MLGSTLGSYRIDRELGRGGMGAVYVGTHTLLGRSAAIKVLLPKYSQDQEIVQRFFNEARAATAIKDPGIVEIYDYGRAEDGSAFIVMELCEGESLAQRLRRRRAMPIATALTIARQIANTLAAAHRTGIVHRDLKPDNVFVVPDPEVASGERIKLLDFGIAKLVDATTGPTKTTTGTIMGTPYYMSPEQCRGAGQVDHRSDLYSLGCMLFEMVCGRVPFVGEGSGDIISAHLLIAPPAPSSMASNIPAEVEDVILRLLAKKPDDRFADADAVADELERLAATIPPTLEAVARKELGMAATVRSDKPVDIRAPTVATSPPDATPEPSPHAPRRAWGWIIGSAVVALLVLAAASLLKDRSVSSDAGARTDPAVNPSQLQVYDFAGEVIESIPRSRNPERPRWDATGALDKGKLSVLLRRYRDVFGACANTATGDVKIVFWIGVDGSVTDVRATGLGREIDACLEDALKSQPFPKPPSPWQVNYPIRFLPSETTPGSGSAETERDEWAPFAMLVEVRPGTVAPPFEPPPVPAVRSRAAIEAILEAHRPKLMACLLPRVRVEREPAVFAAEFIILDNGKTSKARTKELSDRTLSRCVVDVIEGMTFPPGEARQYFPVRWQLRLQPKPPPQPGDHE